MSLPVWECGLKLTNLKLFFLILYVTPCMGVWIEILRYIAHGKSVKVTPCMGVWIEIIVFLPYLM